MEAILNVKLNPQLDTSKLSGVLSGLSDSFTNSVNNFAKFGLMKQGIEATAGAISNLTGAFVEYGKELRTVRALGVDNFTEVDNGAKNLAKTMGISVVDAMKMFGNAVGSGTAVMDGNNVVLEDTSILLEGIAKGAVAGGAGMEEYSKSINAILNGFGAASTEVGKFNDMIFQAANVGVGTGNEFATAMAQMAGSSKAAGIDVEVLAGSLATLSLVEPSVSQSQTKLARLFNTLQAPSKELSEAMDTLGLTMADFSGDQMIESLSKVREYMDDTGKSAVEVFGNAYSASAFLTLTNDIEKSAGLVNTFYSEAAGTTEKAYDLMSNSVANKLDVFNNKIKNAKEKIGEFLGAGGVQLAGMASTAMKELGDFGVAIGGIKNIVSPFGNLLKKLFPDLLAVGAGATTAGAGATTGAVGFSTLAGAVGSALVPLLPFIAAGVGIAGLVVLFWNWDEAMEKLSKTLGISATTLDGLLSVFKLAALPVFYITNLVKGLTEKWVSFDNFIQVWKNRFTDAISGAKKWVTDFIDAAVAKFKWLNPVIEVVKETVANMKNNFYYLIAVVKEVANAIGNFAKSVGGKIGEVLFGTKAEQDKAAQQLEKNTKKAVGDATKAGNEASKDNPITPEVASLSGEKKQKVYEDLSSFYQSVKSLSEGVQTQYIDIVVDVDKSAELKRAEKELKSAHEVLLSLQEKYNEASQKIASKNVSLADKNALKNELQTIQAAMVMQRGLIESYADNIVDVKKKEIHKREENVEAVDEEIVAIKRLSEIAQSTYIPLQVEATELTLPEFEKIDFKFDFANGMGKESQKARKALETQLMLGEISVSDYNKKLNDINNGTIDNSRSMLAQVAQGLTAMTSDYLQQSQRMLEQAETNAEKLSALSQVMGATMVNAFAQSAAEGNSFIKSMVLSLFEALKAVVPVFVTWITGLLFSQMGLLGLATSATLTALLYAALSTAKSAVASASFWAGGMITAGSNERKDTTYAKVAKYEYIINRDATLANLPLVEELNSNRGVINWNSYFDKNPDVVYNYISKKPVTAFYNPNGIQSSLSSLEERVGQIQAVVERLVKTNSPRSINNSIIRDFLENQVVKTINSIIGESSEKTNNYKSFIIKDLTNTIIKDYIKDCVTSTTADFVKEYVKDTTTYSNNTIKELVNNTTTYSNKDIVKELIYTNNTISNNAIQDFAINNDTIYDYIQRRPAVLADRAVYHYSINININNVEKELKEIKETMYVMKDYMNATNRRHINIHGNVILDKERLIKKIEFEQNILRNK